MLKLGARSTRSSVQWFEDRSSFEVGHDHLKLTFSSQEGEPIHYENHRRAVCYSLDGPVMNHRCPVLRF